MCRTVLAGEKVVNTIDPLLERKRGNLISCCGSRIYGRGVKLTHPPKLHVSSPSKKIWKELNHQFLEWERQTQLTPNIEVSDNQKSDRT
jgi:hypothetical protein